MLIVGITGGTGCGKTTIVHQLLEHFSKDDTILISQDDYYHDLSHLSYDERVQINFDHPDSIDFALLEQHLKTLKKGSLIEKPEYSFVEHNRSVNTRTIVPKRIILLEGILIFTLPEIRKLLDLKIYIKAHSDIRLQRRIKRDIQERGRDIEEITERYENTLTMGLKGIIQRIKVKNKVLGYTILGLANPYILISTIFVVWMLFFDGNSWLIHRELNQEIKKIEGNTNYFDKEIQQDKKQIKNLKDSTELERFAREEHFMKRENEEIYIIEYEDSIPKNEE